jgi:hypothetical protein
VTKINSARQTFKIIWGWLNCKMKRFSQALAWVYLVSAVILMQRTSTGRILKPSLCVNVCVILDFLVVFFLKIDSFTRDGDCHKMMIIVTVAVMVGIETTLSFEGDGWPHCSINPLLTRCLVGRT